MNKNSMKWGMVIALFVFFLSSSEILAVESINDSLKLEQFKREVQPYLATDNEDYQVLLQRHLGILDSLASSGKNVKVKKLHAYQSTQKSALRQVILGDITLRDTFLVSVRTTLQQKYTGRKAKYWTKFEKVLIKAADNFVSEYADISVADWEAGGLAKRLRTPHGGGPVVAEDADLIHFVPGGSVVRRVLYRESEVNPKPQFPGGEKAYKNYLQQNVKYPPAALKKRIQGAVRVGFTVKADGTISNVKLERKVHHLLDQEALRVVKAMPKWKPGYFEGKPVPVKMTVPVQFRLVSKRK